MHIKDADFLHRKGVVVFQIDSIPGSQRAFFHRLGLVAFLICFIRCFRIVNELRKFNVLNAFLGKRPCVVEARTVHKGTINQIHNLIAQEVGVHLNFVFAVPSGGIGKVDVRKVRKIRFAQPLAFTKIRDCFLRIVYLGLTGVAFGLLFRFPFFISLLVVFIQILVVVDQQVQTAGNLVPRQQAEIIRGVIGCIALDSQPLGIIIQKPSFAISEIPSAPADTVLFFQPVGLLLYCRQYCGREKFLYAKTPLTKTAAHDKSIDNVLLVDMGAVILDGRLPACAGL